MTALVLSLLVLTAPTGGAAAPTEAQLRFFESKVRPVLVEHCGKCHGAAKQWGGLRVDSREALLRGGDSGPALVVGDAKRSLLIKAVRREDPDLKMPPDNTLTDAQIADLTRWIDSGAAFPANAPTAARVRDPQHWAFQPIVAAPLPLVKNSSWAATPMDLWILSRLESQQLVPTPAADRETLLRRVTFDLTGLPVTPDERAEFLADASPDAYGRLVDRLLAAPTYGERWGRHWLDVARYADSNGLDENIAHGNAWRYRDYVVAALNQDKPFDQFLREQLAGDLLATTDQSQLHERLIATGFLSIGPKVLAEVNEAKMRMDLIDEQLDTVGRTFLAMTFGCARCHDHKFDPIDMTDYYGLAGVFKSTRTMQTYTKVAKWHEHRLPSEESQARQADYERRLAEKKKQVEALVARANDEARRAAAPEEPAADKLESLYPEATKKQLATLREELATLEKSPPDLPAAMGVTEDKVVDVPLHLRGSPTKTGAVVPRQTPRVVQGPQVPAFRGEESGRRELAEWLVDPRHPLTTRVLVNRVWRWHFGRGIVPSTDNFGLLGERPSQPELLDWLARRFQDDGWSWKQLHRLLLASATYGQSSEPSTATLAGDPENRWFSRMPVRRLDAEEIRDSLLAVSGQLDQTFGGSLLKVKNRDYLFDHTSIDRTDYSSVRRSLYLPVIRNHVYDVFQLLDFPDPAVPTGSRSVTTVAPQALLMLNSELTMQSARELARRVLAEASDDDQRVGRLVLMAWGRESPESQRREDLATLAALERTFRDAGATADARQLAWEALCQIVLASNEFIYVR